MAGKVASQGVQTEMVQYKGHNYDHCSMLTVYMAHELIEHSIITKEMNGKHAYDMLTQNLTAQIAQVSDSAFVRKTSGERGGRRHWPEASA